MKNFEFLTLVGVIALKGFVSLLPIWTLGYISSSLIGSFECEVGASCIGPILEIPLFL